MSRRTADMQTRLRQSKTFRFTDTEDTREHNVYRVYDAEDHLLYVGCAVDVHSRIYMHMQISSRSMPSHAIQRHAHHVTYRSYATKAEAREAERRAITDEAPLLNKQHNPAYDPADLDRLLSTVTRDVWGGPPPVAKSA